MAEENTKKSDTISLVYNDFYGSIKDTFTRARAIDKSIKLDDVKDWFAKNQVRKGNLRGYNSFIAQEPYQEYQIDLFFVNDLEDQDYKIGLMVIDTFSKYMTVVPLKSKQPPDMLEALKTAFENMGKKPKDIYSDDEGSLNSKLLQDYLREQGIRHIVTRTHAPVAERAIRSFKSIMYRRIDAKPERQIQWTDTEILSKTLTTYNYIMKSRTHGTTPNEARHNKNHLEIKMNLEAGAVKKRRYPTISVGDRVRIYKKKGNFVKERYPVWSSDTFRVERIDENHGQDFYYVSGRDRALLRHEILLIP